MSTSCCPGRGTRYRTRRCRGGLERPRDRVSTHRRDVGGLDRRLAAVAGATPAELHELLCHKDFEEFLDADAIDRVPVLGPIASIFAENGWAKGTAFRDWLFGQLKARNVTTFADLEITNDPDRDPRAEHGWKLMVTAADVTTGELLRLPQDYRRYGLEPNEQFVADAVRASISVPYLFEPYKLRHADGTESLLVDGGLVSNYPLDAFNRTDGHPARWRTLGVTVVPKLPAGDIELIPELSALRHIPGFHYLESLVVTAAFGRDQSYLEQPWISRSSIALDSLGVNPFDFSARAGREGGFVRERTGCGRGVSRSPSAAAGILIAGPGAAYPAPVRSVAVLLALLVAAGIALRHFGYGAAPRSPAADAAAAQRQAEHSLTLLDVWAQSMVPGMLLEQSRARALGARNMRVAARLARRLRIRLLRAESFESDLEHDPELRSGDSIDARTLQDAASAWREWASAVLRLPVRPSHRSATRVAALEARAVRLHQAAYAVVDASLRTAVTGR